MRYTIPELAEQIAAAERAEDLDVLDELEKCFVLRKEPARLPLAAPVAFRPSAVKDAAALESDAALTMANSLARARKRVQYRFKRRFGSPGPILVAEGDSWFEFPIVLDDVIDHLLGEFAVLSLAGAGDLLADMAGGDEFTDAIAAEGADFFLISGGGNDMLHGGRLSEFLNPFQNGMTENDVFRPDTFTPFVNGITNSYRDLVGRLTTRFPNLTVLCHGYDYALPRNSGTWLGAPLAAASVPRRLWAPVVRVVIDRFNEGLKSLESLFPGRLFHIDCRNAVGGESEWHDELHPKNAGFGRAAARFAERVRAAVHARGLVGGSTELLAAGGVPELIPAPMPAALSPMATGPASSPEVACRIMAQQTSVPMEFAPAALAEAVINPPAAGPGFVPRPLDRRPAPAPRPPADGGMSLRAWQARLSVEDRVAFRHYEELMREYNEPEDPETVENRREMLPGNDVFQLERIIGRSDIFQVNFLSRGDRAARTVGRIAVINPYGISLGFGTGSLVGPGLLLTNNHVLDDEGLTANSHVLFEYEYDADNGLKQTERFALSRRLFFTSKELDFTLVAVEPVGKTGRPLTEFGQLMLIPESGKALKGEYVSIIQHANGLPKQIAMRDSQILGRKEQFIYYTTDTNPGSSGAPVVNDEWFPVALHHRAVPDFNKPLSYVCNRGIRVSAIFEHLERAANRGDAAAAAVLRLLRPSAEPAGDGVLLRPGLDGAGAPATQERIVEPFHEDFTVPRPGYDANFLGIAVPLPTLKTPSVAAKRLDMNSSVLTYEHFSIVMHKKRRLALFTASNVDASPSKKEPEPGRDYSRKGLGGLGKKDTEKWFEDPRLASAHQLPDRFFTKDRGAFDRGHLVRREDVAFGTSYDQVRRANGDTYHVTNCSPQVAGFNQSKLDGLWGELEDVVLKQAKQERYCVLAGPVLDPSDRSFRGKDLQGEVLVQIPSKYWKVVVARSGSGLQSFAFVLEQDLSDVPLEFAVDATWRTRMVSVAELEALVRHIRFPAAVRDSDQVEGDNDEVLAAVSSYEWIEGP